MHQPRRSLAVAAVLLLSTISLSAYAQELMPPPPGDPDEPPGSSTAVCRLPSGCNGIKDYIGNGRWGPCYCGAMPGETTSSQISCDALTSSAEGCEVYKYGTLSCNDQCQPDPNSCAPASPQASWKKTVARFSDGLKAFNKVDCGGPGGTCPFVDASDTYTLEGKVSKLAAATAAPLRTNGCALDDPRLCRFQTPGDALLTRMDLSQDMVNNGRRNEVAVLREDCGTKYHPAEGEDRYYAFSVTLPSNLPAATSVRGNGNHILWQIHEESNCVSGGPYFGFYLRRNDLNTPDDHNGTGWHLTFHERETFTSTAEPVRMWPDRNTPQTIDSVGSGGSTHFVVVHKKWSRYGSAAGSSFTEPPFGATEVWLDGVRVYSHLRATLFVRDNAQALTCDLGKSGGSVVELAHKMGLYVESKGDADAGTYVPNYLPAAQLSDVVVAADCQSVWRLGGVACPR